MFRTKQSEMREYQARTARRIVNMAVARRDGEDGDMIYATGILAGMMFLVEKYATKQDCAEILRRFLSGSDAQEIMEAFVWQMLDDEYSDRLAFAFERGVDLDNQPDEWFDELHAEAVASLNAYGDEGL